MQVEFMRMMSCAKSANGIVMGGGPLFVIACFCSNAAIDAIVESIDVICDCSISPCIAHFLLSCHAFVFEYVAVANCSVASII